MVTQTQGPYAIQLCSRLLGAGLLVMLHLYSHKLPSDEHSTIRVRAFLKHSKT